MNVASGTGLARLCVLQVLRDCSISSKQKKKIGRYMGEP